MRQTHVIWRYSAMGDILFKNALSEGLTRDGSAALRFTSYDEAVAFRQILQDRNRNTHKFFIWSFLERN